MATKNTDIKEAETKVKKDDESKYVTVMVPYIDGEDPFVTVIIDGYVTKFRKGEPVKVKRNVAQVLKHSSQQMMVAQRNQKKFENQSMDL